MNNFFQTALWLIRILLQCLERMANRRFSIVASDSLLYLVPYNRSGLELLSLLHTSMLRSSGGFRNVTLCTVKIESETDNASHTQDYIHFITALVTSLTTNCTQTFGIRPIL